jgi:hypothetical protein
MASGLGLGRASNGAAARPGSARDRAGAGGTASSPGARAGTAGPPRGKLLCATASLHRTVVSVRRKRR